MRAAGFDYVAKLGAISHLTKLSIPLRGGAASPRRCTRPWRSRLKALVPDRAGIGVESLIAVDKQGVSWPGGRREGEYGDRWRAPRWVGGRPALALSVGRRVGGCRSSAPRRRQRPSPPSHSERIVGAGGGVRSKPASAWLRCGSATWAWMWRSFLVGRRVCRPCPRRFSPAARTHRAARHGDRQSQAHAPAHSCTWAPNACC